MSQILTVVVQEHDGSIIPPPIRGCFDKSFIMAGKRAIYGLDHTALDDHSIVSHRVSQRIERTALAHSLVGVGDHSI